MSKPNMLIEYNRNPIGDRENLEIFSGCGSCPSGRKLEGHLDWRKLVLCLQGF